MNPYLDVIVVMLEYLGILGWQVTQNIVSKRICNFNVTNLLIFGFGVTFQIKIKNTHNEPIY